MAEIVNRVAQSSLVTINLEKWYPEQKVISFDIADYLFQGLILKEKDFRQALADMDWTVYQDAFVHVLCSADAIIPTWAYMLIGTYLGQVTDRVYYGTLEEALTVHYHEVIKNLDIESYRDAKVILKGCSQKPVPNSAYLQMTIRLERVVRSLMFGEACSAVPIYKKKNP